MAKKEKQGQQEEEVTEFKVGRDAISGKFIEIKEAREKKDTAVVETIRIPRKSLIKRKKVNK